MTAPAPKPVIGRHGEFLDLAPALGHASVDRRLAILRHITREST